MTTLRFHFSSYSLSALLAVTTQEFSARQGTAVPFPAITGSHLVITSCIGIGPGLLDYLPPVIAFYDLVTTTDWQELNADGRG